CASRNLANFAGVMKDVFDTPSKIVRIAQFKKDQTVFIKVVGDTGRPGSDHRFSKRQVFENACWSVELCENAPLVGNHTDIARLNGFNDLFQRLLSLVLNRPLETALLD